MSVLPQKTPDEVRLFKASIFRWTMMAAGVLLLVAAIIGRRPITLGFIFGLCVGLLNFDLMTRFNIALLSGRGSFVPVVGLFVRFAILFAGAAGVWYKHWDFIAAGVGCFLVYPVIMLHGVLRARHKAATSAETEG